LQLSQQDTSCAVPDTYVGARRLWHYGLHSVRIKRKGDVMKGVLLRTMIIMLGLAVSSAILPGVSILGTGSLIFAAILLALVNAIIRPIAFILTLPLTIVTMGLFIFVLNAAMFGLVASMLDNFYVAGFWSAIFGSIIVSITSTIASWYIGPEGRYEVYVMRRSGD
jgi:putative membrane protein